MINVYLCIRMNNLSLLILEKEDPSNVKQEIQKKETAQEDAIPKKIRGIQFFH